MSSLPLQTMPTAANKKRTKSMQLPAEAVFEDQMPPPVLTVRSQSVTSANSSVQSPASKTGSKKSLAVQVNVPSDSSSDDETCRLPSLRYMGRQVYKYTVGAIKCPRRIQRRRRLDSSISHDSSGTSSGTSSSGEEGEEQHLLARQMEKKRNRETEREIRRKLKFHFMNPFQKWKYAKRRRFPFKLVLQLLAVILVTAQIILFGEKKSAKTRFILSNKQTINTLFLDFDSVDDMMVYSMDDLYHQIQQVADTYYNIENIAVAPYDYLRDGNATHPTGPPLLHVIVVQYDKWKFDASNHDIYLSHGTHTTNITLYDGKNETCYHPDNCTIQSQLEPYVNASSIGSIKSLSIHFKLTSFFVDQQEVLYISCVTFDIKILFNNAALSGTIPVEVTADPNVFDCNQTQKNPQFYTAVFRQYVVLDMFVFIVILVYSILCLRSMIGSCLLTRNAYKFFKHRYNKQLTWGHIKSLQNFWFYGVILGNILVVLGTVLKVTLAFKFVFSVNLEDWTTLILGLGVFCQWCGLLRFLSYFESYNILLLTLRLSIPSVIRFVVCAGVLYIAFMFLGWLVLGPYHTKFTDLSITSECLFSLLNGDDMYMTYKEMPQTSYSLWVFSKIYLYLFIALFIYVVLSVFIGLISDTYETLNEHWYSRSKGFLHEFALGGMARWKRKRKAMSHMHPTFQEVQEVQTGEGFILVHREEEEEEDGEGGSRNSASGEDTDGGYRSNNGETSPTIREVRTAVPTSVRSYGSVNRSNSDGRKVTLRHTCGHPRLATMVSLMEDSTTCAQGTGNDISMATLPPGTKRQRRSSWPSFYPPEEGTPPPP